MLLELLEQLKSSAMQQIVDDAANASKPKKELSGAQPHTVSIDTPDLKFSVTTNLKTHHTDKDKATAKTKLTSALRKQMKELVAVVQDIKSPPANARDAMTKIKAIQKTIKDIKSDNITLHINRK